MPFQNLKDYGRLVSSYLNGELWLKPLPEGFSNLTLDSKITIVHKIISKDLSLFDLVKKLAVIRSIDEILVQAKLKYDEAINNKINELKYIICLNGHYDNWKDALFGIKSSRLQKNYFSEIQPDIDAVNPLCLNELQFKQKLSANSYSVIGSSFKTNKLSILGDSKEQHAKPKIMHCLDALYLTENHDSHNNICGFTLALGDGAGGHFGDAEQDKQIARAAYFGSKHAVRLSE